MMKVRSVISGSPRCSDHVGYPHASYASAASGSLRVRCLATLLSLCPHRTQTQQRGGGAGSRPWGLGPRPGWGRDSGCGVQCFEVAVQGQLGQHAVLDPPDPLGVELELATDRCIALGLTYVVEAEAQPDHRLA